MSNSWAHRNDPIPFPNPRTTAVEPSRAGPGAPGVAQYGLALVFVALAAALAFVAEHLVAAPNVTLIFVLPVVVAATLFGWGPALLAAVAGVMAFDFFFTQPYFSLRIDSPSDLWAAALLLVIAAVASSVAAQSRRRALATETAVRQAHALRDVADLVVQGQPQWQVLRASANALYRTFRAPAVIAVEAGGAVKVVASAGGAKLARSDEEAALGALRAGRPTRAGAYPYDAAKFDFWPLARGADPGWAIGVAFQERPDAPERFVDLLRGYIAAAVGFEGDRPHG